MDINEKWERFAGSGKISDYLEYKNCQRIINEQRGEKVEVHDRRSDNQGN